MKNSSISKINTAGLIGYIVSIVLMIATITGMVFTAILGAAALSVSKDSVQITVNSDIGIVSEGDFLSKLDKFMSIEGIDEIGDLGKADGTVITTEDSDLSSVSVKKQDGGLVVNAKTEAVTYSAKKLFVALVCGFIFLGAVTVCVYMLKRLMKALKNCETPFSEDVIKRMSGFAYSLIPAVALNIVFSGIWSSLSVGSGYNPTINIGSILLVAVVFVLVAIFKYGAQLQRESDETL